MKNPTGNNLFNNDLREVLCESNSVSSSDSYSEVASEEEEDGCLDDWEAVADALNADDNHQHSSILNSPAKSEPNDVLIDHGLDLSKAERRGTIAGSRLNPQAWMPDDASRLQSLPSLSKQAKTDWHCGRRAITWTWQSIISQISSCPICCEDLDVTDSSFVPCPCGFRLCHFCHKRILEADCRCPGCRKQYDLINDTGFNGGTRGFQVVHSYSMSTTDSNMFKSGGLSLPINHSMIQYLIVDHRRPLRTCRNFLSSTVVLPKTPELLLIHLTQQCQFQS